jgi:hypothetical protein
LVLGAAAAAAVLVVIGVPVAAGADGGNRLLASGTVSEAVAGGDWLIQFRIHARGNGQSSEIAVHTPDEDFSYDTSLCRGSFTDPVHGGTTVYGVGETIEYVGNGAFKSDYYGYAVNEGGPFGADFSWVVPVANLAEAQTRCANPASMAPPFSVNGGSNVLFKV